MLYLLLLPIIQEEEKDQESLSSKMQEIKELMTNTLFIMHRFFKKCEGGLESLPLAALQVCSKFAGMTPGYQVQCLLCERYNSDNYLTLVKAISGAVYHGGVHEACIYHLQLINNMLYVPEETTDDSMKIIKEEIFTLGVLLYALRFWKWDNRNLTIKNLIYRIGKGLGGRLIVNNLIDILMNSLDYPL